MGLAREKELSYIHQIVSKKTLNASLQEMIADQQVIPVQIKDLDDLFYTLPVLLENHSGRAQKNTQLHILSPFDNLIIQRERLHVLFGFDYTLECYLPKQKRKYGYFSLPILWQGNFVGRCDLKADRKSKTLLMQSMHYEKGFKVTDPFITFLKAKLKTFALFNGCKVTESLLV